MGTRTMVQRVATVAFEGIEARAVDVQVQVAPGLPAFNIVGLPDKAVSEAKERVRAALDRLRASAARPPHHHQSGARRPAQGRQPLRPADRARADGRDRRVAAGRDFRLHRSGRARPRRLDRAGRRRLAGRHRRQCARARADLSRRVRTGSGLGQSRDRDRFGAIAHPARQSFQGHAGALAPAAEDPRDRRRAARFGRHQGPGERQARARGRRRRRP